MNRWLRIALLLVAALVVAVGLFLLFGRSHSGVLKVQAAPVLQAGTATVRFADAEYTIAPGDAITIQLQVQGAENLGGWELALSFDPAFVAVEAVTPGAFLSSTGRTAAGLGPLETIPGQLMIGGYSYGTDVGVSGDGTLAHIRLRALAAGQTALGLSQLQLAAVQGTNVEVQPSSGQGGQLNITPAAELALSSGWNLLALPRTPADPAPAAVFAGINGQYDLVYAYDGCDPADPWKKYVPGAPPWVSNLTSVSVQQGLWVRALAGITLTVPGPVPVNVNIPLCAGWNLVGYPAAATRPITTALSSIAGQYVMVYAYDASNPTDPWQKYVPGAPPFLNTLAAMGPGIGYWIQATQATTLVVQ
jgi:hypothetical protein